MELTHTFTVPTAIDATWDHFQDIGALAECFPGAQVTSVGETDDGAPAFAGTCKVKLGPIALLYTGSGSFVDRDEKAHRFVVEAKGKDKRGNGTAGATVTLTMQPAGEGTSIEVVTDLAITGKPAQFGRGVMQDVSDKLLGQFVACLEQRLGPEVPQADQVEQAEQTDQDAEPGSVPTGAAAVRPVEGADPDAGPASAPAPPARTSPPPDDALDLGATVLPVLVKSYGKQVLAVLLGLLVLRLVVRRLRG
jgi:uncharacterized protein